MMNNGTTTPPESMLDRITKLLAKAESTNHPAEAEALTAKATELMMKWAISDAMLAGHRGADEAKDEVVQVVINLEGTYWQAHLALASAVGSAFDFKRVRLHATDRYEDGKRIKIHERLAWVGFKSDIEKAQLLYASLLLQAGSAVKTYGREHKAYLSSLGGMDKYIARRSFLFGFAERVGHRLVEMRRTSVEETPGAGLVLVDRQRQVSDRFGEMYPRLGRARASQLSGNMNGSRAGRDAGSRANLGSAAGAVKGGPLALGR